MLNNWLYSKENINILMCINYQRLSFTILFAISMWGTQLVILNIFLCCFRSESGDLDRSRRSGPCHSGFAGETCHSVPVGHVPVIQESRRCVNLWQFE